MLVTHHLYKVGPNSDVCDRNPKIPVAETVEMVGIMAFGKSLLSNYAFGQPAQTIGTLAHVTQNGGLYLHIGICLLFFRTLRLPCEEA